MRFYVGRFQNFFRLEIAVRDGGNSSGQMVQIENKQDLNRNLNINNLSKPKRWYDNIRILENDGFSQFPKITTQGKKPGANFNSTR